MAITWNFKITPIDVGKKVAGIIATRTDDTDPENIEVSSFAVLYAALKTQEQKLAVLDNIWAQHQASLIKDAAVDAFVGGLEQQAKDNLEARE